MKTTYLSLIFILLLSLKVNSQDASVEKSIYGVQTGFLGIWAHNESKLSSQIALRTELGLDAGITLNGANDFGKLFLAPVITVEPRWYYNLNRRVSKSKRIDNNSGNFISIKTSYHPDWFLIAAPEISRFITDLSIVPTYGIRRHIGNHFTYETGFGIGYVKYFDTDDLFFFNEPNITVNLHLRLGYTF